MAKEKLTLPHYCDIAKHDTLPLNANMITHLLYSKSRWQVFCRNQGRRNLLEDHTEMENIQFSS
jgi:hypothetical protein